jgi:hypothetical protein
MYLAGVVSFLQLLSASALATIDDGLLAYFPFDGNANDASGNGAWGEVTGATLTEDRFGSPDSAYSFTGFDFIRLHDQNGGHFFIGNPPSGTISAWVYARSHSPLEYNKLNLVIAQWNNIQLGLSDESLIQDGLWVARINDGSYVSNPPTTPPFYGHILKSVLGPPVDLGQWTHIAATWDSSELVLYLDGEAVAHLSDVGRPIPVEWQWPGTTIGAHTHAPYQYGGSIQGWDSGIDEVRIYNRALSAAEIRQLSGPIYTCVGFEPPMDKEVVKARGNRALPLKADLVTPDLLSVGSSISSPPVIEVIFAAETAGFPLDVTAQALAVGQATDGNQFVLTGDNRWTYNLKLNNYTASGTYTISMVSGDDSYAIEPTCESSFVVE